LDIGFLFFFSSRRRHTRFSRDWSSDVCSSDLPAADIALELTCEACAHRWHASLDVASLIWDEISANALRLFDEVHRLATAYGWKIGRASCRERGWRPGGAGPRREPERERVGDV